MSDPERQLRLDTLSRGLGERTEVSEYTVFFLLGLGVLAVLAVELLVFVPAMVSFTHS